MIVRRDFIERATYFVVVRSFVMCSRGAVLFYFTTHFAVLRKHVAVQVTSHWRMNHNRHNAEREPWLLGKRNSQTPIADKWCDMVQS